MTTKKRIFILGIIYAAFYACFLIFLALASKNFLSDIQMGLYITYSLIFPLFMIAAGISTYKLSVKPIAAIISLGLATATTLLSLPIFNLAYPEDDIKAINGLNPKLSIIDDVGIDYIAYILGMLVVGYLIALFASYLTYKIKGYKICTKLAEKKRPQTKVDDPMLLKVYNKMTNKYEKYLIWRNKNGLQSSERIIYYDKVELVMVDSNRKIYAMLNEPEIISMRDYQQMLVDTN